MKIFVIILISMSLISCESSGNVPVKIKINKDSVDKHETHALKTLLESDD